MFRRSRRRVLVPLLIAALVLGAGAVLYWPSLHAQACEVFGYNPHPVVLRRPRQRPLSAMARLGEQLFHDPSLSASGRQSCASCHDPARDYGPSNALPAQFGGPELQRQGTRPPPSLKYLERQPNFSIGPDNPQNENVNLQQLAAQAADTQRGTKQAGVTPVAPAMVPQGGMFWDGRADNLQAQAYGPLLNPFEMANSDTDAVAAKLDEPQYRKPLEQLFGPNIFNDSRLLVAEATSAIARYQFESPKFHPYDSKYDAWLEGKARFTAQEKRGYALFNDPQKGNCAACHVDQPTPDHLPPLFTDFQYEALGVPRNPQLKVNDDPNYFDIGLCGPMRTDMKAQTQYCSMFLTPTLRNTARRQVFFHNGRYHKLEDVVRFYDLRETQPERIYPKGADGKLQRYDDVPPAYRANIDRIDAPFDLKPGDTPPLDEQDIRDIVAFIGTLNDGWMPRQ